MDFQEFELTARLARFNPDRDWLRALFPEFTRMVGLFDRMKDARDDEAFAAILRESENKSPRNNGKSYPAAGALFADAADLRSDEPDAFAATAAAVAEAFTGVNEKTRTAAGGHSDGFIVIPNVL